MLDHSSPGCVLMYARLCMDQSTFGVKIILLLVIGLLFLGSVGAADEGIASPTTATNVTVNITASPAGTPAPIPSAVAAPLAANFTQNRTSGPVPLAIQFYDRSSGGPVNWSWDFGDGSVSAVKNPVHRFTSPGTYSVTLHVGNPGSSDTRQVTDLVRADPAIVPVAAMSANKTGGPVPLVVQFYDKSTGYPTTWSWDFGDGTTATVKNPVHTYSAGGNYTVTLGVTNPQGSDTKIQTDYIRVSDAVIPVAAMSANKTGGPIPLVVQFYDKSTGYPTTWSWDFGDGSTSSIKNPVHMYTTAGNFMVNLTVSNAQGSDTKIQTDYIRTSDAVIPVAALSANRTTGPTPFAVQFYDKSAGYPTTWSWDFGDGSTSSIKNPVHMYTTAGNFTVNLTVSNAQGSDTKTQTDYIRTSDAVIPAAALSANRTTGPTPLTVQFYDKSTGYPTSWTWNFGDGTIANMKNPVHTYAGAGNFTVSLTIANAQGSDTKTIPDYVRLSLPVVPSAAMTANLTSWSSPAAIQFYDKSTGYPTMWSWDFGDGSTSSIKNPVHTYTTAGNFTVNLTVSNAQGSDTKTQMDYIRTSDAVIPVAALSANRTTGPTPLTVQFYDKSTGYPTSWTWNFGDGTIANMKNPVHTYAGAGNFTVCLTVTNALGSDTKNSTGYIRISDPALPVAALTANRTSSVAPMAVQFYDKSTGYPASWIWDFGDGTTSTVKNPVHIYSASGNYTVNLTAINAQGTSSVTKANYIHVTAVQVPLAANLSANITTGMAPLAVNFTDCSTGYPVAWNWSFGDGNVSSAQDPFHLYPVPGNYTVGLSITDAAGTNSTVFRPDYIQVSAPFIRSNFTANATVGQAPLAVAFTDLSEGTPIRWNWSFGDGEFADAQNPVHVYNVSRNYTVSLIASNAYGSDNRTVADYMDVRPGISVFHAVVTNTVIPSVMKQEENVTVNVVMNNTGLSPWARSTPAIPGVYLAAAGVNDGDALKFGPARIDIALNTTVVTGQEYTFQWIMQAPNVTGQYYLVYRLEADGYGPFGPEVNASVKVVNNESVIRFTFPKEDIYANETVNVTGSVSDAAITNITVVLNGVDIVRIPVENGNFTAPVPLAAINNVTVSGVDSQGLLQTATILLDGDGLPGDYEQKIGFDPQNPDSDNYKTTPNEAGNGISDGYELLNGDRLPVMAKFRLGADPFRNDTDGDGLTDYFEVMNTGLLCDPRIADTNGNTISDAQEDPDNDGLTNLEEQSLNSVAYLADSDRDGLSDKQEQLAGTSPLKKDSDSDGLGDDSEIRLGTNPLVGDTDGDGIPDGQETFTTTFTDQKTGSVVVITGKGDLTKEIKAHNVTSPSFLSNPARIGDIIDYDVNGTFDSASITMSYDPTSVPNPSNLTMGYFNETYRTYVRIPTTVDTVNHTVTVITNHFSKYLVLDDNVWNETYVPSMNTGAPPINPNIGYQWHITNFQTTNLYSFGSNFPAGKYAIVAEGAYNNAVLNFPGIDWTYGAISAASNYGDLGMWVKYGSQSAKVSSLVSSGNVLIFEHHGGEIGVWNRDMGVLSDDFGDATYTLWYVGDIDSDVDGIPDLIEQNGFYDGNGNFYQTDPNKIDTDNDGLTDAEEMGTFYIFNNKRFFALKSDPTKADSDGDGIEDYQELKEFSSSPLDPDTDYDLLDDGIEWVIGSDLLLSDSDGDGYTDDEEYYDNNPDTSPVIYENHYGSFEIIRDINAGIYLQGYGAGRPSIGYLIGWVIGGFGTDAQFKQISESVPYKDEINTGVEVVAMLPQCGGGEAGVATQALKTGVRSSPELYDDAIKIVNRVMKDPADAEKAAIEMKNVIQPPATEIARTQGFTHYIQSEKWLAQEVGGEAQVTKSTILGNRRIDQLSNGVAHEIKIGRVYATKDIKMQIDKDILLLKDPQSGVTSVEWHFGKSMQTGKSGYSQPLEEYIKTECQKNSISYGTQFKLSSV